MESPAPEHSIADAIAAFLDKRSDGAELLKLFRTHVERRTRNYPPVYFGGERDSDAIASIVNEVFMACMTPLSWAPFDGRTPFDLFVSERHNDGSILWLVFQGQFSIVGDVMRRQPARYGGPDEHHRRQIGKVLNGILSRTCSRGASGRWSTPVRSGPAPSEREALVPWLVGRYGPLTRRDILQLTLAWEGRGEIEEYMHESSAQLDVREIVVEVWHRLDPWDRALVVSIARGDPYTEVLGWFPARDSVALSRRLSSVNRQFIDALGMSEAAVPPKVVAERLGAVLAALPVAISGVPRDAWTSGARPPMVRAGEIEQQKGGERTTKLRPFGVPPRLQRLSDADAAGHCLRILDRGLTRGFLGSLHAAGVRRRGAQIVQDVPVDPPDGPAGALGEPERFVICDDRWLYAVAMPSGVSVLLDARRPFRLWGAVLPFGAWTHMEGKNIEDVRTTVAAFRG